MTKPRGGIARRYWQNGRCPCCGMKLDFEGPYGEQPATVAEGVMLCGFCMSREHDAPDVLPQLLQSIVTGIDNP